MSTTRLCEKLNLKDRPEWTCSGWAYGHSVLCPTGLPVNDGDWRRGCGHKASEHPHGPCKEVRP